jgi:ABC-type nitrate/sulfonate/bicarbonate transport system substrate-binding protein
VITVAALIGAACGDDDDADTTATTSEGSTATTAAGASEGEPSTLGFAFEATGDPLMAYLQDEGILEEVEQQYNVKLELTETPDDFAFFAGNHGNVVMLGTYEIPLIQQETEVPTVVFGGYRNQSTMIAVRADDPANSLADLKGRKIAVDGPGGSVIVWGILAKALHDLDFDIGADDFEVISAGSANTAIDLVRRGEADATICLYELCAGQGLAQGELKVIYDGRLASELYADELVENAKGPAILHNAFVAREDWYDSHPNEVAFILDLFQRGADAWHEDAVGIMQKYPEALGVEEATPEIMDYLAKLLVEHDAVRESMYLSEEDITNEEAVVELMRETGFLDQDAPGLRFEAVTPAS